MDCYQQINPSTTQLYFATCLHYNCFFSIIYFILQSRMIYEKLTQFRFNDELQMLILLPSFSEFFFNH